MSTSIGSSSDEGAPEVDAAGTAPDIRGRTRDDSPPSLSPLQIAERLLAITAIGSAMIWVMLNALYVEFYDDFGLRPEDVGWDRLTVLSRAAWLAIVAIFVVGAIAGLLLLAPVPAGKRNQLRAKWILVVVVTALATLTIGFFVAKESVETQAQNVRDGSNVDAIEFGIIVVDVRATWATADWISDDPKPGSLNSPHLAYIGHSDQLTAFIACGVHTVTVPSEKVSVTLLSGSRSAPSSDQVAAFRKCPVLN